MYDRTIPRVEHFLRSPLLLIGLGLAALAALALVLWLAFPWYQGLLADPFWFPLIVMAVMLGLIINATAVCILAERKIAGFTQDRYGPNRVGFWGLFQPVADGLKFLLKEDIIPWHVDKPLFLLAPFLAFTIALVGFAIIPWAGAVRWPWSDVAVSTQVLSLNVGVLYLLAVGALAVYGIVLAGYASNNKYAFYGGMRAAAQIISYELPLGLGLLCVLLTAGTLRPEELVNQQAGSGAWYVLLQPLAFFLMLVSSFAETNRAPFDLPEAEQELVGGYHTEYSALKFGMFFLAEYAHMITGSALLIALFFGGWAPLPLLPQAAGALRAVGLAEAGDALLRFNAAWATGTEWWLMLLRLGVYLGKIALFIFVFMLVRWTLPRFRFDQLMRVAWQSLVPVGVVLVVGTALLAAAGLHRNIWAALALNAAVLVGWLWTAARSRRPVTGRQTDLATPTIVRT